MTNPAYQEFEQQVLPLFEVTRASWLARARAVAHFIGQGGKHVTIDMVRDACPPPEGVDPRCMGAVFRCGKTGPWEKVGYVQSDRKQCHGRPIAQFRLKSEADA